MSAGEKAPYFPFYVFDWDSDYTQRKLDCAGAGILVRLMTLQWIEGGLEDNEDALRTYCSASPEEWARAWRLLERKFPVSGDGYRRNARLEHERQKMESKSEQGRAAAHARHARRGSAVRPQESRKGSASVSQSGRTANQNQNQNQRKDLGAEVRAPDGPPETPEVYWDNARQAVEVDEQWLREELAPLQSESKVTLTRSEYEFELEQLRLKCIADPRLRACIQKRDGKPSTPSKFKAMATLTVGHFSQAIRMKARRQQAAARASPNSAPSRRARTDEALREMYKEIQEEEGLEPDRQPGPDARDTREAARRLPNAT